jgi:mannose-6-phosphate isomerase
MSDNRVMSGFDPYPLRFAPVYKQAIWGGRRIADRYGRAEAPFPCGESWEISAHADGAGPLLNGPLAGATLAQLAGSLGRALLGRAAPAADKFPLLFKIIDAQDNLSLQVHPDVREAARTGAEAKSETWYLLDTAPGACLFAGLRPGTTIDELRAAIAAGRIEQLLVRHEVAAGEALHVPAGLVHAIGAGCLVYEVQQSANTTYRLHDWRRIGADGRPRALHLDAGLRAVNAALPPPSPRPPSPSPGTGPNRWSDWPRNPHFRLRRLELAADEVLRPAGESFVALFTEHGTVDAVVGARAERLTAGGSCLIPAAAERCLLRPVDAPAVLLVTSLR